MRRGGFVRLAGWFLGRWRGEGVLDSLVGRGKRRRRENSEAWRC